jgi:hypothetical protein
MAQNNQTQTGSTPTATQILESSWATSVDSQTAQQFTGLAQVRQARANQLQRQVTALTATYGATDPAVLAAQASLTAEQTFASRLGMVSATTSTTAPTAPANGWVVYGRVRNADLTPAPQLTVFLADEARAWLQQYAFAFTDQTGYFTLSYTPPAAGKKPRQSVAREAREAREAEASAASAEPLSAYVEVSNSACKLMYVDAAPMSVAAGAVVYRDIVLSAEVPLGTPPCEPGAPPSVPPATKQK